MRGTDTMTFKNQIIQYLCGQSYSFRGIIIHYFFKQMFRFRD